MPSGEIILIVMLARKLPREVFVEKYPGYYLVGIEGQTKVRAPIRTLGVNVLSPEELERVRSNPQLYTDTSPLPKSLLVLPVRKAHSVFDNMITLGRTANNDIVVSDASVSKFHAYFNVSRLGVELVDAGSLNGTFVGDRKLDPKGAAARIEVGTEVRFGTRWMVFLDAPKVWDHIHGV